MFPCIQIVKVVAAHPDDASCSEPGTTADTISPRSVESADLADAVFVFLSFFLKNSFYSGEFATF
jgi:hypothetical protein